METINLDYPDGATPLDPQEISGLIPPDISTQSQLNEAEQKNIISAELWLLNRNHLPILSEPFLRTLHKKMFENVWRWAGQYRKSEKNLGIAPHLIHEELHKLLSDTDYWLKHHTYSFDELGARFHHRLVSIHPFANGNGRFSRLLTDLLLTTHHQSRFTWGANLSGHLKQKSHARTQYIQALKKADNYDYTSLILFVRS